MRKFINVDGYDVDGTPLIEATPHNLLYHAKQVRYGLYGLTAAFVVSGAIIVGGTFLPPVVGELDNIKNSGARPGSGYCAAYKHPTFPAAINRINGQFGLFGAIPLTRAQLNQIAARCG
jgi:hypothetical protein